MEIDQGAKVACRQLSSLYRFYKVGQVDFSVDSGTEKLTPGLGDTPVVLSDFPITSPSDSRRPCLRRRDDLPISQHGQERAIG